jgi:tetratricopeptide (TPR) repeat protein
MMKQRLSQFSAVVLVCAAMAGCATQNSGGQASPEAFNKALSDADAVAKGGDQARALALYDQLTKTDPTREEPWSRIAQIQFQQAHYGQAIVAAQEALSRDQSDRDAKSVLAVSGLRVATESLGQLRQDAALAGDAKSDAAVLAHQLRDTLGESTLFPEEVDKKPAVKKRRYVRRPVAAAQKPGADKAADTDAPTPTPAPSAPPAKPAAPAQAAKSGGASDPFSALR